MSHQHLQLASPCVFESPVCLVHYGWCAKREQGDTKQMSLGEAGQKERKGSRR